MEKVQETVATFNKMAEKYQDKYMDCNLYSHSLDKLCEYIYQLQLNDVTSNKACNEISVLEVGCGPGNVSCYLSNWRNPDKELLPIKIYGFDLAPNMVRLANANNPQHHYDVLDMQEILTLKAQFDRDLFNVAVCAFSIPYLNQQALKRFIEDMPQLLAKKSILFISFMAGDYKKSMAQESASGDRVHMYYYEAKDLARLLTDNGFEVIEQYTKDYIVDGIKQATDCFMYLKRI
ncbi:class I SAM-dependent DNA methyltransferase [Shewanella goraebulensis]|uniref:class I SAM-dependent DNA methyltransferase n=1 Tax=Shewanella goraebulensis TaxID=3050637 RepID=UPI00254F6EAC|nr:class I SAM-dependent methyltransferase [Shewanella goraebulensis]